MSLWGHPHPASQANTDVLSVTVDQFHSFMNFTCKSTQRVFFCIWLLPLSITFCSPAYANYMLIIGRSLYGCLSKIPILFSQNCGCPQLYLSFLQAKITADFLSKLYYLTWADCGLFLRLETIKVGNAFKSTDHALLSPKSAFCHSLQCLQVDVIMWYTDMIYNRFHIYLSYGQYRNRTGNRTHIRF